MLHKQTQGHTASYNVNHRSPRDDNNRLLLNQLKIAGDGLEAALLGERGADRTFHNLGNGARWKQKRYGQQ